MSDGSYADLSGGTVSAHLGRRGELSSMPECGCAVSPGSSSGSYATGFLDARGTLSANASHGVHTAAHMSDVSATYLHGNDADAGDALLRLPAHRLNGPKAVRVQEYEEEG